MRYTYQKDRYGLVRRFSSRFINLTTAVLFFATTLAGAAPLLFASQAHAVAACATVCINEIHPSSDVNNRWVELYNPTAGAVSLNNWRINRASSQSANFGGVFGGSGSTVPSGQTIASHGFYVVMASTSSSSNGQLSASGDTLTLSESSSGPVDDTVTYPSLTEGQSYGRSPDGSDNFVTFTSSEVTPGASNYVDPPATPQITSCPVTNTVKTTDMANWDTSDTEQGGNFALTADGLDVSTSNGAKVSGYYYFGLHNQPNLPLKDVCTPSIDIAPGYTGTRPSLQLTVDHNGNGQWYGNIVYEPWAYGTGNWWSTKNFGISSGMGYASFGTLQDYLNANPNTQILAVGYSLGSGVNGSSTIESMTAGNTTYTFATPVQTTGPVEDVTSHHYFNTIQSAIDDQSTQPGDKIKVSAGTYNENVNVDKAVNLVGAQSGIAGDNHTGSESHVNSFTVSASNVTINGFTISPTSGNAIKMDSGSSSNQTSGEVIMDNVIDAAAGAVEFNSSDTKITNNLINYSSSSVLGVQADNAPWNDIKVTNNTFSGTPNQNVNSADINFIGAYSGATSPAANNKVTVSGNTSTNPGGTFGTLVAAASIKNLEITDNTTSNQQGSNIYLAGGNKDVVITGNHLTDGARGVKIDQYVSNTGAYVANSNVRINKNYFTGDATGVIVMPGALTDAPVNALDNWWGSPSGPTDQISGDGSIPDENQNGTGSSAVGAVDYGTWCTLADCSTLSNVAPGTPTNLFAQFQYDSTHLTSGSTLNKTSEPGNNNLELEWTAPSGWVNGYHVIANNPDGTTSIGYGGPNTNAWLVANGFGQHGNGTYTYQVVAVNNSGSSNPPASFTLYYDTQAPTVTFTNPSGNYLNTTKPFTISGTYSDNLSGVNRIQLYISKGAGYNYNTHVGYLTATLTPTPNSLDGTFSYTLTQAQVDQLKNTLGINDGDQFTITAVAIDNAGNGQRSSNAWKDSSITLTADNTPPSVPTLLSPVDRGYERTNDFYFKWNPSTDNSGKPVTYELIASQNQSALNNAVATGDVSGVWDSVRDGASSGQYPLTTPTDHSTGAGDGVWYWAVRAIDQAGNQGGWSNVWHFTIDTKNPSNTINSPTSNEYVSTRQTGNILTITGTATDNIGLNRVLVQLLTSKHGAIQNNTVYLTGTSQNWSTSFNVKTLGLADGQYSVSAVVTDNAGNTSAHGQYVDFTLDNTKPVAIFTSSNSNPTPNGYYDSDFQVGYDVSDNLMLKNVGVALFDTNSAHTNHWATGCYSDASETGKDDSGSCTVHLGNLPDGKYYVAIQGQDAAGNYTVAATRYITIDRTTPSTSITSASQSGINTVSFDGNVSDTNLNYYYCYLTTDQTITVNNKTFTPGEEVGTRNANCETTWAHGQTSFSGTLGGFDVTGLPSGNYTVNLVAYDLAGNNNAASPATYPLTIDHTAPAAPATATWDNPPGTVLGSYTNSYYVSPTWSAVTKDVNGNAENVDHYNYSYSKNGAAWSSPENIGNITSINNTIFGAGEGSWQFRVQAVDKAGNLSAWTTSPAIIYDKTPPVVAITSPSTGDTLSYAKDGTVPVMGTVTDANPNHYYYQVTGPNGYSFSKTVYDSNSFTNQTLFNWNLKGLASGAYTIDLEARDSANNKDPNISVQKIKVTVDNTAPTLAYSGYSQNANVITPKYTDPDSSDTYQWTAANNNPSGATISDASALNPNFTVVASGNYSYSLVATDNYGNTSTATFTFTYTAPSSFTQPKNTALLASAIKPASPGTTGTGFTNVGGNVLGAQTTTPSTGNQGQVKGDQTNTPSKQLATTASNHTNAGFNYNWLWLLLLLLIPIYYYLRSRTNQNNN